MLTDGITPFVTGGMQRHSYHLVNNLLKLGVKVTLFHCVYKEDVPSEETVLNEFKTNNKSLNVFSYAFPDVGFLPGHYIRASRKYSKLIVKDILPIVNEFDFIYSKGFSAWELLKIKKKGKELPPISVKFHGYEMYQPIDSWKEKIKQIMLQSAVRWNNVNADYVFSYGGKISTIIENIGVSKKRIVDICSGISDEWVVDQISKNKSKRKFLFIGRNERRKGIQDLLAIQDVIKRLNADFYWVGPIPESSQIQSENCTYFGEVKKMTELRSIIDQCDVLVTPSHSEGMPNVILEAMARGLAIIATDVGAVPMMVSDINGVLIPPFNREALKKAILNMNQISDDNLLVLQQNSLSKVKENFLWSSVAVQHIQAIRKIIKSYA